MKKIAFILCLCLFGCDQTESKSVPNKTEKKTNVSNNSFVFFDSIFEHNSSFKADGFDFPVGKPDAKGYYNAQKFTENNHLGEDWNGKGGGNTDLGDPIYAIANGYVTSTENHGGGWGNVIRIVHLYKGTYYESLYAHCEKIVIKKGSFVTKGTQIGTIGNADGNYYAHVHLEIRDDIFMELGGGYSKETKGFLDPTLFINANRN